MLVMLNHGMVLHGLKLTELILQEGFSSGAGSNTSGILLEQHPPGAILTNTC